MSERTPRLSDDFRPPVVMGIAALTTAAMNGADAEALADMVGRFDDGPAARAFDTAIAYQLAFRRAEGLGVLDDALALSPLFRIGRDDRQPTALRVLALCMPGTIGVNMPLDFISNNLNVRLDLLFLLPDESLPAILPDHDVAIFAASEPDAALLDRMVQLYRAWPRPALNDPSLLPLLARDRLCAVLADIDGICSPAVVRVDRARLERLGAIDDLLPSAGWPVLVRPVGSHAGIGLKKLDGPDDLRAYLTFSFASAFYVTAFVDYRSADGLHRKYRIVFIEGRPYLAHMAASAHWMVHYLNAGMADDAAKRADEAAAMAKFPDGFATRHARAFASLCARLPFEHWSIDCAEMADGRLIVFEADTAAIVHAMDPPNLYPYKPAAMRLLFDAFGDMLGRYERPAIAA